MKVYLYVQKSDILYRPEFFQTRILDLCSSNILSRRTQLTLSCTHTQTHTHTQIVLQRKTGGLDGSLEHKPADEHVYYSL